MMDTCSNCSHRANQPLSDSSKFWSNLATPLPPRSDSISLMNEINKDQLLAQLFSTWSKEARDQFRNILPENVPRIDIIANIERARRMDPFEFKGAVRNHGIWDFKQLDKKYQAFGNVHYGIVAAAFNWNKEFAMRMAGWAQVQAGTSKPEYGHYLLGPPYGDDPNDQLAIEKGFRLYEIYDTNDLYGAIDLLQSIDYGTSMDERLSTPSQDLTTSSE